MSLPLSPVFSMFTAFTAFTAFTTFTTFTVFTTFYKFGSGRTCFISTVATVFKITLSIPKCD